ncbi:MAG: radical SAM protein [Candidatus Methanoperedens sp.]|nr:radical SAM protein [Candidatus Methanoperedens sp.]MCZ7360313.1 radical SAM protein [Candidatus Methanoperedens sp.]HLB70553.1 radical SAM protein [Candidatus Methanoperedens sp.]
MNEKDSVITYGCFHPDYAEEMKYFEECNVYTVQIESTLACSQGCLYCYAASEDAPMKELLRDDIITIIDSAARMEVRAIDWLGGDPLLRGDWYELMKYAMDRGLKNNIWTSGIPLENLEVARKAVEVTENGFISVHLDSLDEKIYGKLHTGDPRKKIQAILKGVDNVQSLGKRPENMINCITFTKLLADEDVKRTTSYFFKMKGMRTCLTQMCMTGLAVNHPEWIPGIQEIRDACGSRDEVNYSNSNLSMSTMDANKFYCGGIICVTIDGDVTPCSVIRKGFGNIYESTLENIVEQYRDELLFAHLRNPENVKGYCSSCENNQVCWGCRATAYYEKGDMLAPDPRCWINPDNYCDDFQERS